MVKRSWIGIAALLFFLAGCHSPRPSRETASAQRTTRKSSASSPGGLPGVVSAAAAKLPGGLPPGLYANFQTTAGAFVARLFPRRAPRTVADFVALATGHRPWNDPATGMMSWHPLYDGLEFFRVVPGFIIQAGDPANTGNGSIGFDFPVESNALRFNRAGRLSLAQAAGEPASRSSQFFVTLRPAPELDRQHFIIFGQVVRGMAVVRAIASLPRHPGTSRPRQPAVINQLRIGRVGSQASGSRQRRPGKRAK